MNSLLHPTLPIQNQPPPHLSPLFPLPLPHSYGLIVPLAIGQQVRCEINYKAASGFQNFRKIQLCPLQARCPPPDSSLAEYSSPVSSLVNSY